MSETYLGSTNIIYNPAMDIMDSTKLESYQQCPRGFMLEHIFGWRPKGFSVHLVFGQAWHELMEQLLLGGYGADNLLLAWDRFEKCYDAGVPAMSDTHKTKNKTCAFRVFQAYVVKYMTKDQKEFKTLWTEIGGAVPIAKDRFMHIKIDAVIEMLENQDLWIMDHKTGSANTYAWRENWRQKIQIAVYAWALWYTFPEKAKGLKVNGAIIRTRDEDLIRVPVQKSIESLHTDIENVNLWYDRYEDDMNSLKNSTPDQYTLKCFPHSVEGCGRHGKGCQYDGMCAYVANPLTKYDNVPYDYVRSYWNPVEREIEEAKFKLDTKHKKIIPNVH